MAVNGSVRLLACWKATHIRRRATPRSSAPPIPASGLGVRAYPDPHGSCGFGIFADDLRLTNGGELTHAADVRLSMRGGDCAIPDDHYRRKTTSSRAPCSPDRSRCRNWAPDMRPPRATHLRVRRSVTRSTIQPNGLVVVLVALARRSKESGTGGLLSTARPSCAGRGILGLLSRPRDQPCLAQTGRCKFFGGAPAGLP